MKKCHLLKELLYKSVIHIRHYLKFSCENLPITFKDLMFSQQRICRFHNNMVLEHRSTMITYQQGVHSPYLCVVKDPSEFWRNSFQTDEDLSQTVSATDLCHLYFNTLPLQANTQPKFALEMQIFLTVSSSVHFFSMPLGTGHFTRAWRALPGS